MEPVCTTARSRAKIRIAAIKKHIAVVVGAPGVFGRPIVDRLASEPGWEVIGLSRPAGVDRDRVRYLDVGLRDTDDTQQKLAGLTDATHVFYAVFQATGTNYYGSHLGPFRTPAKETAAARVN